MTDYLKAAFESANFIRAQKLEGQNKWRRSSESGSSDLNLYHGSAGIILFLLELHASNGAPELLAEAVAAGEELAEMVRRASRLSVSVSHGWPGYAFVLSELSRASGRSDFRALAATCLERLHSQSTKLGAGIGWIEPMPFSEITGKTGEREIYDQSVGAAGAGLVFLYAARNDLHPEARHWAIATAERLLEVGEPTADGVRWGLMSDMPFAFTAPNFAHGGAGVGYFMAELFKATGDGRYLSAAKEAARYVLSRASIVGDGKLICHTEEAKEPMFYLGACHGPPGTGRLFLELFDITGDAKWLEEARALVRGLLSIGAPETRSKGLWNNHSQCCGDAGIGEFALLMASRTGEKQYLDLAMRCADAIIADSTLQDGQRSWRQAEHRDRPEFTEVQTGYMQGAAGIASFLLHLATTLNGHPVKVWLPDWPQPA